MKYFHPKIFILFFLLQSCVASSAWRERYCNKIAHAFAEKYDYDKLIEFNINCSSIKSTSGKQTKRELKRIGECIESGIATIPDSISQHTNVIDSFYTNKNKIHFIKKHSLITEHKHLMQ